MKISLISPLIAPKRQPQLYNIGLGYIASVLKNSGYEIDLLDIEGFRYSKEKVTEIIKNSDSNIFAIGTLITAYEYTKWLTNTIKRTKPNAKIWVGNSIGATIPEIILNQLPVDVVVIGEGEITVKQLAHATEHDLDLNTIKGICFKKDNGIIFTPEQTLIEDLDSIPFPAWELFPQKIYFNTSSISGLPEPTAVIITARGCPYRCTYCYHPFQNKKVRFHSAQRVIEEIKYLKNIYKIKGLGFADDLFISKKSRVYEICDLIEKNNLNIKWHAAGRVNLVDRDLLKRMKSAGCVNLGFGIESGSNKILKNIKKDTTSEQARKAIKLCQEVGINPLCSFMIGNVGETHETVQETVNFMKETDIMPHGFFFATPYPKTELYDYAKANNLINDEIKLIEAYGEQGDNILVNFTAFSNDELFALRTKATKTIARHYRKKHFLKFFLKKIKSFYNHIRLFGFKRTYEKIILILKQEF